MPPDRSLNDFIGHAEVVRWLQDDLSLWRRGQLDAMPMGYLLCGPVGTGKTFLAECLAGEAGIPVVKLRNFRDKWVGSSESNLERIFRLLHGLGRCVVFVDEADQSLGSRQSGTGDSGLGGRVYAMLADEMSDTRNSRRPMGQQYAMCADSERVKRTGTCPNSQYEMSADPTKTPA